ncbi:MAG: DUF1330 domain-containing protein [Candidatus Thorarchaeota archaeon]|nr:DUF1330 domain-containing protein [Candidatus Thorarchaeota archaeon]
MSRARFEDEDNNRRIDDLLYNLLIFLAMKGYVIADVTVTDSEMYADYASKAGSIIKKYGGKVIIWASKAKKESINIIEGDWNPTFFGVIQFKSVEKAKEWYNSPEYTEIIDLRFKSASTNLTIVAGV